MKVRFIINPRAGGSDKTAIITDAVREELSGETGLFEIKVAAGSESLKRLSEEAVRKGYDVVFACGGDGREIPVRAGDGLVSGQRLRLGGSDACASVRYVDQTRILLAGTTLAELTEAGGKRIAPLA